MIFAKASQAAKALSLFVFPFNHLSETQASMFKFLSTISALMYIFDLVTTILLSGLLAFIWLLTLFFLIAYFSNLAFNLFPK